MMATKKNLFGKVKLSYEYGAKLDWDKQSEWQRNANGYHCTIRYQGRKYSFDYWMGIGITREPGVEDALESLLLDAGYTDEGFESWCSCFGYDTDSRKAEATFKACQRTRKNLERLFGDDFQKFMDAR